MHSSHSNRRQRCGVVAAKRIEKEVVRTQVHSYEQLSINRISPSVSLARLDLVPESVAAAAGRTQQIVEDVKLTSFWHDLTHQKWLTDDGTPKKNNARRQTNRLSETTLIYQHTVLHVSHKTTDAN